jgi:uncharacterized membrane protein
MKALIALVIASMCMFSLTTDAFADLQFCNHSGDNELLVAVAYEKGHTWVSQGWWAIHRGECKIAVGHRLHNQYYYYYARNSSGSFYGGDHYFCVDGTKSFLYHDPKRCPQNEMKGFKELDVGNSGSFIMNFRGKRSGRDQ